jgi:hypothetical protein
MCFTEARSGGPIDIDGFNVGTTGVFTILSSLDYEYFLRSAWIDKDLH